MILYTSHLNLLNPQCKKYDVTVTKKEFLSYSENFWRWAKLVYLARI